MLTRSRAVTLAVVLIAAALGLIAGLFMPPPDGMDRVLRIASAVALSFMVGAAIVAKRLPRRDVSRFERGLRAVLFRPAMRSDN